MNNVTEKKNKKDSVQVPSPSHTALRPDRQSRAPHTFSSSIIKHKVNRSLINHDDGGKANEFNIPTTEIITHRHPIGTQ